MSSGESGERTGSLERAPRTLKTVEGQMLVQTSSPLHHCSSGSTKSLPPGVLQPEPAPAPTESPTTNSYIAQSGTAYASAGHGHRWTPQPRLVYWSPGNYCTLRQRPAPVDIPHVVPPGYTYQHQPPRFPHPCRRLYPHTRTRHATDAAAFHTCGSASNPNSQRLLQTDAADPHPTHGRYFGVRSAAAPPTATAFQSRPVYQPTPSVSPLHHGRNRPLLQGHPAHHRPVRHGYRRTGSVPPIHRRRQPRNGHLAGYD